MAQLQNTQSVNDGQSSQHWKEYNLIYKWGIGVAILWAANSIINILSPFKNNAAAIGDSFGVVNALFSGLTFAGLVYTIYQQQQVLKNTREDLELTRQEFSKQSVALEKQEKHLSQQNFETTFFNTLKLFNQYISSIQYGDSQGREFFENEARFVNTVQEYEGAYSLYDRVLGPYFRMLYQIVSFVDVAFSEDKGEEEPNALQKRYINFVRSQLSSVELTVLHYNCLSEYGKKFHPLVEKYKLLKHLPVNDLPNEMKRSYQKNYPRNYQAYPGNISIFNN